ncbi:MAG: 30S ribosomal protein S19e [Promethearchaeota archaeon]|nr:MAG: 30S ribosomal protein S19e [Candidatus Lokiarchaeota archaeon]
MSIYIIDPSTFIQAVAEKLKEYPEINAPNGSEFWKTAFFKELAPVNHDTFWYVRCASLLRKINKFGPIGVNRLRKKYGGRNKKGSGLKHSAKGSGKIIRVALQQLENANLIEKTEKNGRILSNEGRSLLERTGYSISRNKS